MKEEREREHRTKSGCSWLVLGVQQELEQELFLRLASRSCPLVFPNASRQSATHLKEKQLRMRYIDDFVLCPGEQSEEKLPIDLRGCDITFESP